MKKIFFFAIILIACKPNKETNKSTDFEIGIIADCQYCNCETQGKRFYKQSPDKFKSAIKELNTKNLDYTIHLGDFIDRNFESFDTVLPIWNRLKSKKYHVLGNHDFSVQDSLKPLVASKMGLKNRYYSFIKNNWRFIVLDGNDLSYHGALTYEKEKETDSLFNLLKINNEPNLQTWNGGLSSSQLQWIEKELKDAKKNDEYVGFYCHFPAGRVGEAHNLWNYKQFLQLINSYNNVKFYFNGHNHNGDYLEKNKVHHITFKGMLDTKKASAFAIAKFTKDSIFIQGYGRETSRRLKIN
ncbi:metallophosphoesterase [Jejuia spongiicola]|uniref:Metallophosphoesterase n=1 Tax=Jejuia spongiicola TaxID=2942207 RepID=A0ABT0QEX0_9FLAO|nr:metallophosphoesterase [Jejuia spongiicola]MCL6295542.1 metallophosphoesterase [Jejuia spongiicola]